MSSLVGDWSTAMPRLVGRGWSHFEGALSNDLAEALRSSAPESWHPLREDEGGIRQHGFAAYRPMVECPGPVVRVATDLVSQLSRAAEEVALPPVPFFNEVTWTRYPRDKGHITAHRDPPGAGGVIAVFTLVGQAVFRAADESQSTELFVAAGDLVVLRGRGWPTADASCPVHAVDPPAGTGRTIMTMRFNIGGAGAPYFS